MTQAMYKKVIHLFVLSCEKATFLIEKQLHTTLSPLEKLQLRGHLSLCKYCRAYKEKAIFMDKLLADERITNESNHLFTEEEVGDLKEKIKSAIKAKDSII
jgi:predicted anti-sigma-YlaC factor YlaD